MSPSKMKTKRGKSAGVVLISRHNLQIIEEKKRKKQMEAQLKEERKRLREDKKKMWKMCEKEGLVKSKCDSHYFVLEFLQPEAQLNEMQPIQMRSRNKGMLIINIAILLYCRVFTV